MDHDSKLTLHGLQQYYIQLEEKAKINQLKVLLDTLEFNQVMIFVKTTQRADALNALLLKSSFPSVTVHGKWHRRRGTRSIALCVRHLSCSCFTCREKGFNDFKEFKAVIMVATDLLGRGIVRLPSSCSTPASV